MRRVRRDRNRLDAAVIAAGVSVGGSESTSTAATVPNRSKPLPIETKPFAERPTSCATIVTVLRAPVEVRLRAEHVGKEAQRSVEHVL